MVYNAYIVVPLAVWAITQISKFVLAAAKGKTDFRYLYASGGMPSVHSAVVCSLATTALLLDGFGSHLFGLTIVFAAVVMYDSFGVRRSSGEQAAAINSLIRNMGGKTAGDVPQLREVLGHTPLEVSIGAVVGVVLAGLFNAEKIKPVIDFLQAFPGIKELIVYAALFGLIVLVGLVQKFVLKKRFRKSSTIKKLSDRILAVSQAFGWVGLAFVLMQYEKAGYAGWRVWTLLLVTLAVGFGANMVINSRDKVRAGLLDESVEARKRKWLTGKKRK